MAKHLESFQEFFRDFPRIERPERPAILQNFEKFEPLTPFAPFDMSKKWEFPRVGTKHKGWCESAYSKKDKKDGKSKKGHKAKKGKPVKSEKSSKKNGPVKKVQSRSSSSEKRSLSSDWYKILYDNGHLSVKLKKGDPVNIMVSGKYVLEEEKAPKAEAPPFDPSEKPSQNSQDPEAKLQTGGFRLWLASHNVVLDSAPEHNLKSFLVTRGSSTLHRQKFLKKNDKPVKSEKNAKKPVKSKSNKKAPKKEEKPAKEEQPPKSESSEASSSESSSSKSSESSVSSFSFSENSESGDKSGN